VLRGGGRAEHGSVPDSPGRDPAIPASRDDARGGSGGGAPAWAAPGPPRGGAARMRGGPAERPLGGGAPRAPRGAPRRRGAEPGIVIWSRRETTGRQEPVRSFTADLGSLPSPYSTTCRRVR